MPRLTYWAVGLVGGLGGAYAGYHRVYLPRHAALLAADQQMEASKAPYQDVVHAFARLQAAVDQQAALHAALSASASPAQPGGSVWYTNAEKICFFCDVQRVRAALLAVPRQLATERDLCGRLRQLGAWEARHCSELNFRVAPLTWSQTAACALCCALYYLCFRVVGPLLRVWQGGESAAASHMQHRVATHIIDALGVRVSMTVEAGEAAMVGGGGDTQPQYIALNAAHWIEEVGFWACRNNPLLKEDALPAERQTRAKLICGGAVPPMEPLDWRHRLAWSGPSASATACTTTFAALWRSAAAARRARDGDSDAAAVLAATGEASLGYPLLSDPGRLAEALGDPTARVVPVGISGLPHLLFVDAAHAVPDARPRRTRGDVYEHVQQAQFLRGPSAASASTATPEAPHEPAASELRQWRAARAFPWWRRVWWGGVYGGSRRADTASLHYHLGRPCVVTAYTAAALAASEAAETHASAAAR